MRKAFRLGGWELLHARTDYGRGPREWLIVRPDQYATNLRSIFRNPYKGLRFLFTSWHA